MGTGIRRMKDLMRDAGLEAPEFTSDTFFHAVFRRSPEFSLKNNLGEGAKRTVVKTVGKTVEKIIALIKENPSITRAMLKDQSGLSIRGVEWNLRRLKAAGIIRRVGPDKGGHWEVLK